MAKLSANDFENFFRYYNGEPQQKAGINQLWQSIPVSLLEDTASWVTTYREKAESSPIEGLRVLECPYDSQHNNPSGEGWRECFSSSCAMVCNYWRPDIEINEYLWQRPKYGDSTDAGAQIATLRYFGLEAKFVTWGNTGDLKKQIDRGRPAPVGWLHHGTGHGTGGGHYSVVIGYDDHTLEWVHNDPNGEADLVNGGYLNKTNGKGIRYSYKHWDPRWVVEGQGSGWGLDVFKP